MGSDHRGFALKSKILRHLAHNGVSYLDVGTYVDARIPGADPKGPGGGFDDKKRVDFTDYAFLIGEQVAKSKNKDLGVMICGSGVGASIATNKVNGIRAALVFTEKNAVLSRRDDGANVLCLSGNDLSDAKAIKILDAWLTAPVLVKARYRRRKMKVERYERTGKYK